MFGGKTTTAWRLGLCHLATNASNHSNRCVHRRSQTMLQCTVPHPWSMSVFQGRSLSSLAAKEDNRGLMKQDGRLDGSGFRRMLSELSWRRHPRGTLMMDMMKEQRQTASKGGTYNEEDTVEGNVPEEQNVSMVGMEDMAEEEQASIKGIQRNILEDESESIEGISEETVGEENSKMLHTPVMLKEVLGFMDPKDHKIYLDMTFGAGGHTQAILQQCDTCRVIALDRDPVAYELALAMADKYGHDRLTPLLGKFSDISALLQKNDICPDSIDGVLFDAGCSSMQFDSAERGFAINKDAPLDMRMDGKRLPNQPTAADVINSIDAHTLANIFSTYGEELKAKKIAKNITQYRDKYGPIQTTKELKTIISFAFTHREADRHRDGIGRHTSVATRTFMALRIFVNNELHELSAGLKQVEPFVAVGGKLVALSFHSMEDRIVKRFMQGRDVAEKTRILRQKMANRDDDNEIERTQDCLWKMVKDLIVPGEDEITRNPRSRSAKLRTAIKIEPC